MAGPVPGGLTGDEQVTGEVLGVHYTDTSSGFGVIELAVDDDEDDPDLRTFGGARCTGPLADLTEGQTVTLVGRWTEHARYGRTFEATFYEQVAPSTVAGITAFLDTERFEDIAAAVRTRAVTTFGAGLGTVLEHQPERLTAEAGIEQADADALHTAWMSGLALARLVRLLQPASWPMEAVRAVHARFGPAAMDLVAEDPYQLLQADRVRFAHVDALGRAQGIGSTDPRRLRAGAHAAVTAARRQGGHQHVPRPDVVTASAQLLGVDRLVADDGIDAALAAGLLSQEEIDDVAVLAPASAFATERALARDLIRLLDADRARLTPFVEQLDLDPDLTQGQRDAVTAVFCSPVSVLTGGPGTGKTRTVQEVVRAAEAAGLEVALCAPTGRAAKRIEEVVGRAATTVHRLLEARPSSDGGFTFRYGSDEPLPHDLVVADEVSMCDTWLAGRLVAAVEDGAHLLLVGDPDQLPSVGPGDVLRDIVRSGEVPVTALTEIHRQAAGSRIVSLAREVLDGAPGPLKGADGDVFLAEERRRHVIVPRVVQAVAERAPDYFGVGVEDVQVLAPVYRGPVGVDALNAALKDALNPAAGRPEVGGFHVDDRVMQTRNDPELDLANGDVGRVVDLDRRAGTLRVGFPRGEVTLTREQARRLTPAWAVTVHKSQGGEWPVVVLVLDSSHHVMLWRNLVYTAITRARRALIVVGQAEALATAARVDRPSDRRTGLVWRLREARS
ncbi:MAG: AAA family ATPase [Nitriliruptoraceae bacterium]|nr:AAA family ATPase [Nitriliruptoraceae bacterium]